MNQETDTVDAEIVSTQNSQEIVRHDAAPRFAISLDEHKARIKELQEFVRSQMVEGEDYGIIPGTGSKPTLLKPGAEKLNAIFGFAPIVEITNRIEDWDAGFISYEVKVTLMNKRSANVEAEGVGSCNSKERKYKSQDAANIANTILKMAKKRALVDATLSATRASGLFTQDVEDMDSDNRSDESYTITHRQRQTPQFQTRGQQQQQRAPQRPQNAQNGPKTPSPLCSKCGSEMWDNRAKKASGQFDANSPDFSCKDKGCGHKIWPKPENQVAQTRENTTQRARQAESMADFGATEEDWGDAPFANQ